MAKMALPTCMVATTLYLPPQRVLIASYEQSKFVIISKEYDAESKNKSFNVHVTMR